MRQQVWFQNLIHMYTTSDVMIQQIHDTGLTFGGIIVIFLKKGDNIFHFQGL